MDGMVQVAGVAVSPRGKVEENLLSAVVCPLIMRELPQAIANFRIWNDDLPPGPTLFPGQQKPKLIFSFNCAPDADAETALRAAFDEAPKVQEAFAAMEVRFLSLPEEKDRYIRKPTGPAPKYGFKSGPNWMFYETTRALRGEADFIFLMETDCIPLVPNWLRRLSRACARHDDAWVVGAHYSGASPLPWRVARHINGNALYHVGDPDFATFLDEILWPWMLDHIETEDPDLAYDCAWEAYLNRAEMDYSGHHDWIVSRNVLHKFRLTEAIINIGGHAEQSGQYVWTRPQLLQRFPQATIAHGPVSMANTHRRGRYSVGRATIAGGTISETGAITMVGEQAQFVRSVWPLTGAIEPGTPLTITLTLRGTPEQIVAIDLREPSGGIVERRKGFAKPDGERRVKMEFTVPHRFNYLNIAFLLLRHLPDAEPLRIEDVGIAIGTDETVWRVKDFAKD